MTPDLINDWEGERKRRAKMEDGAGKVLDPGSDQRLGERKVVYTIFLMHSCY